MSLRRAAAIFFHEGFGALLFEATKIDKARREGRYVFPGSGYVVFVARHKDLLGSE